MRHSGHLNFDRYRHLLFHFFGGTSRPLGNHGHVVIRDVGVSLHRQIVERDGSPTEQQDGYGQHNEFVVEREVNERANHFIVPVWLPRCEGLTGRARGLRPAHS